MSKEDKRLLVMLLKFLLNNIVKVVLGSGAFLLVFIIPEWICEYAPWVIWILIPIAVVILLLSLGSWGYEHMTEEDDEDTSEETEPGHMNCRCMMYLIDF